MAALSDIRELRTEKLYLCDKITKLTAEIVNLKAHLQLSENKRRRAERDLDRSAVRLKEIEDGAGRAGAYGNGSGQRADAAESKADDGSAAVATAGDGANDSSNSSSNSNNNNSSDGSSGLEREMRRQIVLLEKQLNESESARAAVEMKLTERMARPLPQTEVQITDMRNAMEELRQQCKQRVNAVITEVSRQRR